jgi:toxin ParE1/3/4
MIVIIGPEAEADLERIGNAIAEHNPVRAVTFVRELRRKCEALADAPKGYALVHRYKHDGIRRVVHGNYLIFYHVGVHQIDVMRILHGAMDYEAILYSKD